MVAAPPHEGPPGPPADIIIEPAAKNPRPIFWEQADGSIVGPAQPELLAQVIFAELNTPMEDRSPDTRSAEQVQLDASFPAAKPEDYIIQYDRPGQEPRLDPMQKQNLKQFDTIARTMSAWVWSELLISGPPQF